MRDARREDDWMADAACLPYDTAIFFPYSPYDIDQTAADLCAACPVAEPCLDYALRYQLDGTWGGTTAPGRARMRRERGIKAVAVTLPTFEPDPQPSDAPEENIA